LVLRGCRTTLSSSNHSGRVRYHAAALHAVDSDGREHEVAAVSWGFESSLGAEEARWFDAELHECAGHLHVVVRSWDRWDPEPAIACYAIGEAGAERREPPAELSAETLRDALRRDCHDPLGD
jgi:hypothetical protein